MGYLVCLILAAIAITFWIMGAIKPRRRTWVAVLFIPATIVLGFYFAVVLGGSTLQFAASPQVGWPQLIAMIGGVCALLANPKAPPARNTDDDHGAHA